MRFSCNAGELLALLASFSNACVALYAFVLGSYFPVLYLFSIAIFLVLASLKLSNILFFLRTFFIGLIGYYPILIKTIDRDALFSFVELSTQDFSIALTLYALTSLALLGNEIGLILGGSVNPDKNGIVVVGQNYQWVFFFWWSVPLVLAASILIAESGGPTLLAAAYATEGKEGLVGNMNSIGILGLLIMTIALTKCRIKFGKTILLGLALCLLGWSMFMRGYRQDVLSALFGMYVCYSVARRKSPSLTMRMAIVILALIGIFEIWGVMRAFVAIDGFDVVLAIDQFISTAGGRGVYHFGTVSPVATTFANVIYLSDTRQIDFLYGMSYFEFILRSPPEFIYPGRPKDYALVFEGFGLQSLGGFFELAEAYLNFGFFGAFIVPAIISYLISRAYWNALLKQSAFSYFLMFSILAVFFRGTWYQTFAFYKAFLTSIIIFFVFSAVTHLIRVVLDSTSETNSQIEAGSAHSAP